MQSATTEQTLHQGFHVTRFGNAREQADAVEVPADLVTQVTDGLDEFPAQPWDDVLAEIVEQQLPPS